jgi:glycerate kinase
VTHLVAAPDKFRGTASARDVAGATARAARRAGLSVDEIPLSDGGEGLLDAVGGEERHTTVTGPLGERVDARWQLVSGTIDGAPDGRPVAVIEMAQAAGRALVPHPTGDDPVRATTTGVGELVLAAVAAGAGRILVGCGGSATSDGGWGAVEAIGSPLALAQAQLVVACDVTTPFAEAAVVFGPQKGATPPQVAALSARLADQGTRYRQRFGFDVGTLAGAGAAGGLAGGLAALGGRLVGGFDLVATLVGLEERLARADLVVTGEGHLDAPSLTGKVVGGVLEAVGGRVPVLCVVGNADPDVVAGLGANVAVVRLVEWAGVERAQRDTAAVIEEVVAGWLADRGPGDGAGGGMGDGAGDGGTGGAGGAGGAGGDLAPPAPHAP